MYFLWMWVFEPNRYSSEKCLSIEKIIIPPSVSDIDLFALRECINLKEIEYTTRFPPGRRIFDYCPKLINKPSNIISSYLNQNSEPETKTKCLIF